MATPKWQPATLYQKGAIVQPLSPLAPTPTALSNGNFASAGDDWTLSAGSVIVPEGSGFACQFTGVGAEESCTHDPYDVAPGQMINLSARYLQGAASAGHNAGWVGLAWYDAADAFISKIEGLANADSSGGAWHTVVVGGAAPANAAKVRAFGACNRTASQVSKIDDFVWDYVSPGAVAGLVYRAVQDVTGLSASVEPTWPLVNGAQVVDNEVIWEAVFATRVEWTAKPLFVSGATQPSPWPTSAGGIISDGTFAWTAVTREITDPNCPKSKVVVILAAKVFAADKDIVRYCATLNARDWTTTEDAGFLPTGLQSSNANNFTVLSQYRANLVGFNAEVFQNWIADPDPSVMAIVDQMRGIGSLWQLAAQPVANDLYFLTAQGVRSVSIAAAAENLNAEDVGMPIDSLVKDAVRHMVANNLPVRSTYYPGAGQYWLCFPDYPAVNKSTVFVFTARKRKGSWSQYEYPWRVKGFAQLGDDLYLLGENSTRSFVVRCDDQAATDAVLTGDGSAFTTAVFEGMVEWLHIDVTTPGYTGELEAFDVVGTGQNPYFSIGYDQRDPAVRTDDYLVDADTLTGMPIPLPVSAPTMAARLRYPGGEPWAIKSLLLYFFPVGDQP